MKTRHPALLALALPLCLSGCKGRLALLGWNDKGQVVQSLIDENRYRRKLVQGVTDIEDSVLLALKESSTRGKSWQLRLIAVGLELSVNGGLGPFQVAFAPGVRAFFTNTDNPPPLP